MTLGVLARQRILIVDGDENTRDLTSLVLRAHGADVAAADRSRDALHLLQSQAFDALVSDLVLAGQDGYELIDAVRALPPPVRNIPAVALGHHATGRAQNAALDAGFDWHVSKSSSHDELVNVISEAILGRRMPRRDQSNS